MDFLRQNQRREVPLIGKLVKLSESDLERILSKINVEHLDKNECWILKGTVQDNKKGHQHGVIWYNRKYVHVHRIMYHNFINDVPEYVPKGYIVIHKCNHSNNGRCINPWHMKIGLPKENTNDATKANTLTLMKSHEENPMSKLINTQVAEIRALRNSGKSQREIAQMFGETKLETDIINQEEPSETTRRWGKKL